MGFSSTGLVFCLWGNVSPRYGTFVDSILWFWIASVDEGRGDSRVSFCFRKFFVMSTRTLEIDGCMTLATLFFIRNRNLVCQDQFVSVSLSWTVCCYQELEGNFDKGTSDLEVKNL
ncbi:hypothetical protein KC19_5G196900 [Ceratodon purpureus]|uniref:Uncharacterized protein n=1 Tax=Ceratodon purpureus TaxID=3225 RepID=A0A8T0I5L6_CERPU|nr:hypothetical protein KC19_5G196900 [Ceratodon purpureus]